MKARTLFKGKRTLCFKSYFTRCCPQLRLHFAELAFPEVFQKNSSTKFDQTVTSATENWSLEGSLLSRPICCMAP